jgi:hypothetical protein
MNVGNSLRRARHSIISLDRIIGPYDVTEHMAAW